MDILKVKNESLITNKINPADQINFARAFIDAVLPLDGWTGIIKLHPLEKKTDYDSIAGEINNNKIKICTSGDLNNHDVLLISDVFVSHNSIMGLEILLERQQILVQKLNQEHQQYYPQFLLTQQK